MTQKSSSYLERIVLLLQKKGEQKALSIQEILGVLSTKGPLLLLIFLCLPFCQPLQFPGFSTPFGIVIFLLGIQMILKKDIWLPKRISSKTIQPKTLMNVTNKMIWVTQKVERFTHSRLKWVCHPSFMHIVQGAFITFLGIFLTIPIPIPLSNIPAAWSLFFIAFGLLEEDGLLILIGYFGALLTFFFFTALLFLAFKL